ncbi:sulfatase [Streptomyces sp. NPDC002845]
MSHIRPPQLEATDHATEPDGAAPPEETAPPEGTPDEDTREEGGASRDTDSPATSSPEELRSPEDAQSDDSAPESPARTWRTKHPTAARTLTRTVTGLAVLFVLFAFLVPNDIDRFSFARFVRIPAEGILAACLLLVLPRWPRRVAAVVVGVVLGLLTILKFLDMGFYWNLGRPFDLVLDWILLDDAQSFMKDTVGEGGALAATIGVIALAVAVLVLMTLSVVRLTRLMVGHRHTASRTLLVLGTVWITCSMLALEVSGIPLATHNSADLVQNRVKAVRAGLTDGRAFAEQAAVDAFADTPPDELLTGLRGKDVLITFIESYGRSAIDDPAMAEEMDATLTQKTKELTEAGFSSRSGWLRSPVEGAGSWLAHSTFLSGLWIKNQQRYLTLTSGDRLTLTEAFRRTGAWRTVGIVPGTQKAWPEGKFFGLDHIYDSDQLGYQGPKFSWSTMPDQYTLSAFEKLEHGRERDEPLMAEIILTSSHNPWSPLPKTIGWDEVGDGSVYDAIQKAGKDPKDVWQNPEDVRTEYRKSVQYSLTSLVDYVVKYGGKDTVLVFLGDHQPNRTVTGGNAGLDVPVSIVAQDPDVLDRIADWGWTDGLKPASDAPQWRMDTFRDRFLTAYGSGSP